MPAFPDALTLRDRELELRRLAPADRDAVFEACRDPEIQRWTTLPAPFTRADADLLVEEAALRWRDGIVAELVVLEDGRLVGATHLAFHADWRASVAYWLAPEARGRGIATRAVRLLLRWAFETFDDLVRVELWSMVGNEASDGVARRLGFVEEGILRSRLPARGTFHDVRCFSLLRGERREHPG